GGLAKHNRATLRRKSRPNQSAGHREETMTLLRATVPLVAAALLFAADASAQSQPPRAVPTFAVDASWPKVPPQWKLGDASSIAIDAQDNVYVLHRPRTLKPEDAGKAAPAVMVFDPAGNFVKSWGG